MAKKRSASEEGISVESLPTSASCRISSRRGSTSTAPTPSVSRSGVVTQGMKPCDWMRLAVSRASVRSCGAT